MNDILARAKSEGTPLIDGRRVTFVWAGDEPPTLLGDWHNWQPDSASALVETEPGVCTAVVTLPPDAYLEYVYATHPDYDGRSGKHTTPDPFNPQTKPNGIGGTNHYFYMPEATPTPLVRRRRGVNRGTLTHHKVETWGLAAGRTRRVALYRPPTDEPVPLLVVLDGNDYLKQAKIDAIVDNLIAAGRIRPLAMTLVWNGRDARMVEYGCSDVTVAFLHGIILPLAQSHLNLIDMARSPGAYGVLGASMGGLMALYLGLRQPDVFGHVYSQAGAFSLDWYDTIVYDLVRLDERPSLHIQLDNGTYDSLYQTNSRMHALLQQRGYRVGYNEYNAGHNYYAWRDHLAAGLEALLGQ